MTDLAWHAVPDETFAELAAGKGGPDGVALLKAAQNSKRNLILRGVRDLAARTEHGQGEPVTRAYDLISAIQRTDPAAARTVLRYPTATSATLRAARSLADPTPDFAACTDRLTSIAAAAAIRAGYPATVELPMVDGQVHLPSLGSATVGTGDGRATVRVTADGTEIVSSDGRVTLPRDLEMDGPGWAALVRLSSESEGRRVGFILDDHDPYRMPGAVLAPARLTESEREQWRDTLHSAWALLVRRHPGVADEVRSLISTLTPLAPPTVGARSATSKEAIGNIGLSVPRDPQGLAVTLAHEVQHVKLTALIDVVPLTLPDDASRYYAPWREDPRPLAGLLQGAYAHLGVTAFWARERLQTGPTERPQVEFARWRTATAGAIETLRGSGRLTPDGETFVAGMEHRILAWCAEPVPAEAVELAEVAAERHLSHFRDGTKNEAVAVP